MWVAFRTIKSSQIIYSRNEKAPTEARALDRRGPQQLRSEPFPARSQGLGKRIVMLEDIVNLMVKRSITRPTPISGL